MKKTSFFLLILFSPFYAIASVQITEVMYNTPASDAGREWIEVTNISTNPVDLKGYKLFEADTNHGLTLLAGTSTLTPGASALIVKDKAAFLVDWPAYTGVLFKATFSLSNTGEELTLKDGKLNIIDTTSYTSSLGANGDGESLHRAAGGGSFSAGLPDPGVFDPSRPLVHAPPPKPPLVATKSSASTPLSKSKTPTSTSTKKSTTTQSVAAQETANTGSPFPIASPLLGMAALILLGVAGVWYARREVTPTSPEEFDI